MLTIAIALFYAWTCVRFYLWAFEDDPFWFSAHPNLGSIAAVFWPTLMVIGVYMVWRDRMHQVYGR